MLKFYMCLTLGGVASVTYLTYGNFPLDTNMAVNYIIAWAACLAAVIHYESIKNQRKDRLWEINKPVLLELTRVLSEVIEETQQCINDEQARQSGPSPEREGNSSVWRQLDKKIDYALNVYRPLMSKELSNEIEALKATNKEIVRQVNYEDLENIDAYEQSLTAYNHLYSNLIKFINKISGVKYT